MHEAETYWHRLLSRAQQSWIVGSVTLLAGLYLLALPLIFTVFAHETGSGGHYALRIILTALWFVCALLVGGFATVRDLDAVRERAREAITRQHGRVERRELAALASIRALLRPGATGLSPSFRFAVFIPDHGGFLVPVLEPVPQPWQRWAPGCGVVGIAWLNQNDFVEAVGEQTVDPKLGLTPLQREHYGHLTFVAARAIFDEYDQPVGVLSVGCDDGSRFAAARGEDSFRLLASDMGVLVGDARPVGR
jgi:hypothetical protein